MRIPLLSIFVLCAVSAPVAALAGTVTLTQDYDCTTGTGACFTVVSGTLEMNGHTIVGGTYGVLCEDSCRIIGPGTIMGAGIGVQAYRKLDLRGVDVVSNGNIGVQCFFGCKVVGPANLSNNSIGITSTGTMKLTNATVADNGAYGAIARGYPADTGKVNGTGSAFTGNGIGIWADKAVKLTNSTVTANVGAGIVLGENECNRTVVPSLKNTAVTGNGTDPGCGTTVACADLMTCKAPRLGPGSSCDTSYAIGSGVPGTDWDVCSSD